MYNLFSQSLLTDEQVANAPVLILGNKIDKAGAASEDEIRHWFGLHGQTTGKVGIMLMDYFSFFRGLFGQTGLQLTNTDLSAS